MKRSLMPLGIILVAVGILFITFKIGLFVLSWMWPLLLTGAGWLLHRMYFRGSAAPIVLIPGGLFLISSLPLIYANWFGWDSMKYLWPIALFGAAFGLYEYYRYGHVVDRMLFLVASGLGILSAVALCVTLFMKLNLIFLALVLIVAGAVLIQRARQ
jgi:hypothetical protein